MGARQSRPAGVRYVEYLPAVDAPPDVPPDVPPDAPEAPDTPDAVQAPRPERGVRKAGPVTDALPGVASEPTSRSFEAWREPPIKAGHHSPPSRSPPRLT